VVRLPDDVIKYAESPVFTEATVPQKLLRIHDTKPGVWGRLVVLEGQVDYIILGPPTTQQRLDETIEGIIEPAVPHHLELVGAVSFKIEFLK